MTDYERLTAVINENNALRKNTEKLTRQLDEAKEALARANKTASAASGRAESFATALRSQRYVHLRELDAEWNAAIDEVLVKTGPRFGITWDVTELIKTLKREVKP